jgi:hypothetical protein
VKRLIVASFIGQLVAILLSWAVFAVVDRRNVDRYRRAIAKSYADLARTLGDAGREAVSDATTPEPAPS